jgi:hypothetical protein
MISENAQMAALQFDAEDANASWFVSPKLSGELVGNGFTGTDFASQIRRRRYVLTGFKNESRPNCARIYLGLCGNGSWYHQRFRLGNVGTALVFCEPNYLNTPDRLIFEAVPLAQLRFIAGLMKVEPDGTIKRLKAHSFTPDERKELKILESKLWAATIPPFYGDSSEVEGMIANFRAEGRAKLRAILSCSNGVTVNSNDTVH